MPSRQLYFPDLFNELTRHLKKLWKQDRGCLSPAHVLYTVMMMSVFGSGRNRQVVDHLNRTRLVAVGPGGLWVNRVR